MLSLESVAVQVTVVVPAAKVEQDWKIHDARQVAFISDQGSGTFEAFTVPIAGGTPVRVLDLEGGAIRSLCWSPEMSGSILQADLHDPAAKNDPHV